MNETANATATIPRSFPWEDESLGMLQRFWQTSISIFTNPWKTFAQMPVSGGFVKPLVYALIGGAFFTIGQLIATLVSFIGTFTSTMAAMSVSDADTSIGLLALTWGGIVLVVLFVALFFVLFYIASCVVWLFIGSGISHLCLMLFGAARRDFEATFRAVAYAGGLVQIFAVVPCLGWLVMMTWGAVIQVVALKETHRTDYWRVICAYLLPMLLCCGCFGTCIATFGITMAAGDLTNFLEQIRNAIEQAGSK